MADTTKAKEVSKPLDLGVTVETPAVNDGPQGNTGVNVTIDSPHGKDVIVEARQYPSDAPEEAKGTYLINGFGDYMESRELGLPTSMKTADLANASKPAKTNQLGGAKSSTDGKEISK